MKTEQQIQDELAILKKNHENHPYKDAFIQLYKKLSSEDKMLLTLAQSPALILQEIDVLEWVLKDSVPDSTFGDFLKSGEIPYEIRIKLEMYQGRNIHDVKAATYKLKRAYRDGNKEDIATHLKTLRTMVNGICE